METSSNRPNRPRRAETNHALAQVLAAHDNVVSLDQLGDLGIDRRAADRRVASGTLFRAGRNAYSGSPGGLSPRGQRRAVLTGGSGRALAFVTAAAELDLDRVHRGDGLHVLQLGNARWKESGVHLHRTRTLPPEDLVEPSGTLCTGTARTLLDCASMVAADRLDAMIDRSVELRLYDGFALARVLRDRRRAPGHKRLLTALGRLDETAGRHCSNFERRTTSLTRESSILPVPIVNAPLGRFRPDLLFPGTRAIVECDGRDCHRSPAQVLADESREVALLEAGYVILRLRWEQVVYEPARTLRRLEAFYLANAVPPQPGVAGRVVF